jgi:hypothetical protein
MTTIVIMLAMEISGIGELIAAASTTVSTNPIPMTILVSDA